MAGLGLTPQVFAILSALIEERSGLHYALADRELLADKVSFCAMEAGFDSLLDYYYFLRYDPGGPAAMQTLIEALTVHETYFFREFDALRAVVEHAIAPAIAKQGRARIWCAACSTGEEPLTLAMLLEQRGLLGRASLLATDLSSRALENARQGKFGRRALRNIPDPSLASRFVTDTDAQPVVAAPLRKAVEWGMVNLVDEKQVAALGAFDVILCRNVLIYFRDETASAVVSRLGRALAPGGVLLVGVSESLLRFGTSLVCEEQGGAFFYRKKA